MMKADPIGLYIHIPFCIKKCNYCDFCSFPTGNKTDYLNALIREIEHYGGRDIAVDTVFFGGGTPSLLSGEELSRILSAVRGSFFLASEAEITLEVNPATLSREKLSSYLSSGVNRISIGLQSIHENELKKLGRIHSYRDFLDTYNMARSLGVKNISFDLMYGIPDQTIESFRETLEKAIELSPSHLSLYGLILEEGTPLYCDRDNLSLPGEDEECDMYFLAANMLSQAGYTHYEVSNYAKDGCGCRHNLKYWRGEEYIGVGLAAYSYFDGKRFGNTKSLVDYIKDPVVVADSEDIDRDARQYEYVMLRTRLSEGFSLTDYRERFGEDFLAGREERIRSFIESGYLEISNERFRFTDKGLYVGNSLLTELI